MNNYQLVEVSTPEVPWWERLLATAAVCVPLAAVFVLAAALLALSRAGELA